MRQLSRVLILGLLAALLAVAPVAASTAGQTSTTGSAPTSTAALSTAKVVIIVGPTEGSTASYKSDGDAAYATAIQYSSNVVKVYSPGATWAAVQAAVAGASIVVYLGHGNGWPSPYTWDPKYATKDGFGLNDPNSMSDSVHKYYGEPSVSTLQFAPNAVVLLNHLCYASGNSEPGNPDPTLSVAMQRVDNYGQGFLKAGAAAVIAEGHGSVSGVIRDLLTTHQTILDVWRSQSDYHNNEFSFASGRSPSYTAFMDPDQPTGGYYRSLIGDPNVRTEDVTGVPFVRTDPTPDTMGPQIWAVDGQRAISPNGDGLADTLSLAVRFSESVSWTARVRDASGQSVWNASGTGETTTLAWDARAGGSVVPDGTYSLRIGASDAWGNPPLSELLLISIDASPLTRLAGSDRYETSATISAASFAPGVTIAYLATGLNFPDALAGAAAAGSQHAPILLVTGDTIPAPTAAELTRLQPASIVILGSTGVVSAAVETAAHAFTSGPVTRLAGADRYETAAAVSAATYLPGVPAAYLATGLNFPDALAGAAVAGARGAPILLVTPDALPPATASELARLQPASIVILGSTGVVSDAVAAAAQAYTASPVTRLGGADRYATAAAISASMFAAGGPIAYVATGLNFPDALAGAAAAGSQGVPILLVGTDDVPAATGAELTRLHPGKVIALGGPSVVSESVRIQVQLYAS